jgi:quinol monooxygenase YgiN
MTDPVVYIDRSEIREGRLEEVQTAVKELAEFVETNEPQILSYAVYLDEDGRHMNVIHVHQDSASLEYHMKVAGPRFAPFAPLIRLLSIDVYGHPPDSVVEALHNKARTLGGASVRLHPLHAGFVRLS